MANLFGAKRSHPHVAPESPLTSLKAPSIIGDKLSTFAWPDICSRLHSQTLLLSQCLQSLVNPSSAASSYTKRKPHPYLGYSKTGHPDSQPMVMLALGLGVAGATIRSRGVSAPSTSCLSPTRIPPSSIHFRSSSTQQIPDEHLYLGWHSPSPFACSLHEQVE